MKSADRFFPWLLIALGIVLFTLGSLGVIGGIILFLWAMVYCYKNNRKLEFGIICAVIGVALVISIISLVLYTNVTTQGIITK
ncbi:hypothetical protein [Clostridium cellulovorans]|uniref:Uncharacterized protein n=1 Tax=Clostridium cellulovorans (strain ATCC 35296 / DSM 3052 / OCM 3 / 743B) TaxID=573061 RepID=D9SRB9_CLOC7|nr:hypothetical protein [Clostridium cellulovorans]ADL52348.1 hypothetical protein Clocel_2645 [Clostridium cellulovorans 743B]